MKNTGRCPKCGSMDVLAVEPGLYNSFPVGFFTNATIQRYVCPDCGYTEEWIAQESLEALRRAFGRDGKSTKDRGDLRDKGEEHGTEQ